MTLDELKEQCETQGYQPNRAMVLKLLEMIAVLRQPLAEIRDRLQVTSVSHQMAVVGLARADNIERSLS